MKYPKIYTPLLTISLFPVIIFSGYNIITGNIYSGASSDDSYFIFMLVIDLIPLLLFFNHTKVLLSNTKVRKIISVLSLYLCILFIEGNLEDLLVKGYIAYSIPAALIGIMIAQFHLGNSFCKYLELVMLFLSLYAIYSLMAILSSPSRIDTIKDFGLGMTSLAYDAGFAFSLNLFFLLFGDYLNESFRFTRTKVYKLIRLPLLVLQLLTCFSSGGRGGTLLLIISSLILFILKIKKKGRNASRKHKFSKSVNLVIIAIFVLGVIFFIPQSVQDAIGAGLDRAFSYLSNDGFDVEQTSNRDTVYAGAINGIINSPIWGNGLLMKGAIEDLYPHNLIMEILLQGGLVYFCLFAFFMFHVIKKLFLLIKKGKELYLIPIILYPAVMLCFSGSYMLTGLFWFSLTYIVCYDEKNIFILRTQADENKEIFNK